MAERKRIQIVDYRGSKDLTTTNIEDELKKREAQIKLDTFYDAAKARKVESIIKEMLSAKGRPFATVKHEAKNIGGAGQQLSFVITDGPKAKIKEISFDGNTVYSDAKLRGKLKNLKEPGLFNLSWLGGKTTYTEQKWLGGAEKDPHGDRGRLEDFYLDNGYVTARVGQPRITYYDDKPGKKKPTKYMKIEIPVTEGDQYRVGEVKFEGLTVLKEDFVRGFFKMHPNDIYNDSRFKKAYEKLRDVYGTLGYFQWTGGTMRKPDPEKKVVDITVKMEEDKQYFLGRINFTGNDSTRDKVIRREIYMNEGDVFNTEALKMSIKRVNQLGYFKQMESAPDIKPSEDADNKVDVTFKVEEQNRNQFTFGGGVSGLEGTFLNASFSTTNFLGAGETFQIYAQTGKRTKNYSLSISEPYFLDRPITAGVDLFKRKITYLSYYNIGGYTQESTGASLVTGFLVGKWSRAFLNYTYEVIQLSEANASDLYYNSIYGGTSGGGVQYGPAYDPLLFGDYGSRKESRLTPNIVYNTVDNPFTPRKGMRHTLTMQFTGGTARRHGELPPAHGGGDRLHPAGAEVLARDAGPGVVDHAVRRNEGAAVLPALLPRRRDRRSGATRSARSAPSTRSVARSAATSSSSSTPSTTGTCSGRCACWRSSTPARRSSRASGCASTSCGSRRESRGGSSCRSSTCRSGSSGPTTRTARTTRSSTSTSRRSSSPSVPPSKENQ